MFDGKCRCFTECTVSSFGPSQNMHLDAYLHQTGYLQGTLWGMAVLVYKLLHGHIKPSGQVDITIRVFCVSNHSYNMLQYFTLVEGNILVQGYVT